MAAGILMVMHSIILDEIPILTFKFDQVEHGAVMTVAGVRSFDTIYDRAAFRCYDGDSGHSVTGDKFGRKIPGQTLLFLTVTINSGEPI